MKLLCLIQLMWPKPLVRFDMETNNVTCELPFLILATTTSYEEKRHLLLQNGFCGHINEVNWPQFDFVIDVQFYMAHTKQALVICFEVQNEVVRGTYLSDNDPVWEDSCVEVFLRTNDSHYYNFEFNCLGTALAAKRLSKSDFTRFTPTQMLDIKRTSSLTFNDVTHSGSPMDWWLLVEIPFHLISYQAEMPLFVNLYKCGNKTQIPHYLSWAPINLPQPNFHCPEFFREVRLGL